MIGAIGATVAGSVLILAAVVGCVVPVIPGPILAAAALYVLSLAAGWSLFSWPVLIGWTVAALAVQILDNVLPARAAGRAGAGSGGVWGSVVGMLAGTILFPPFGVFIGAFVGAWVGEIFFHRENEEPLKAALAVFRGTLGAIVLKLAVTGAIGFVFVRGAVRLFA
ncbi:MAG: DUF456 domain-containing protein [Spirochaetales bacterium]|nr:DUF456 domain-containing protein [Spirochaetales bacterium]